MARLAVEGSRSALIRLQALELVRYLPQKDHVGEFVQVNGFVRDHIRYVRDISGCETVQAPAATMEIGQGDCDDKSTLVASLLLALGFTVRFVVLRRNGAYCHVWTQALFTDRKNGRKWLNSETTEPVAAGATGPLKQGDQFLYRLVKTGDGGDAG